MISIFYNNNKIPAENDGTPISPPSYWTTEILEGIAQAFEAGEWEPIPDPEPVQNQTDIIGFFNQFVSPTSPGKPVYDSLASRALSIGGVTMLHFQNLQLLLLNPNTTEALVIEGYTHLLNLFDQNGQPFTQQESQALKDLAFKFGINLPI